MKRALLLSVVAAAALLVGPCGTAPPRPKPTAYRSLVPEGAPRVSAGRTHGTGAWVEPGAPLVLAATSPPEPSALWVTARADGGTEPADLVLRVDGAALAPASRVDVPPFAHLRFDLTDRAGARLELECDGEARVCALDPILGPSGAGARHGRPDVVLLLADTFRADNLGRDLGAERPLRLAPFLDDLAEGALRFTAARAPATWTLPSHASMFAGRYPPELGVVDGETKLPESAVTLAERFAEEGYRTAAITDAGYVSAAFGVDQGFHHFEEVGAIEGADPARTLAALERVLARDDPRPLLLFVHSYRSHAWVVDAAQRARLDGALVFQPDERFRSEDWRASLMDVLRTAPHGVPLEGDARDVTVGPMVPNYRGASASADAGFGAVLRRLERRPRAEGTVLVFTSDHGESLGEHGVVSHGNGVWDPQASVPLLIRAPGVAPRDVERPASLIDLPRTLCALAGVTPDPGWRGIDLLGSEPRDGPLFVFQTLPARVRYVAAIEGDWKLLFRDEGGPQELLFAYDLAQDPAELRDLSASIAGSGLELRLRAQLSSLAAGRAGADAGAAAPSDALKRQLEGLGYTAPGGGR